MVIAGDINPLSALILVLPNLIRITIEGGVLILSLFLLIKYRREVFRYLKELFK